MSSIMVPGYSIMRDGISLIVKDSTMVNDLDRTDRDQTANYLESDSTTFLEGTYFAISRINKPCVQPGMLQMKFRSTIS